MPVSPMRDAFAHHIWATGRVIEACGALEPAQLDTEVPGTYGPILTTLRHLVGSDSWYLFDLTGDPARRIDADRMGLAELRTAIEADGPAWDAFLDGAPDPDAVVREVDEDDGFERDAPVGIRLAQALDHGTDHRSQICTALTSLGIEPPPIDVWDFGESVGRVIDLP
jgi:uncharacterized damage-inducible protein DinB